MGASMIFVGNFNMQYLKDITGLSWTVLHLGRPNQRCCSLGDRMFIWELSLYCCVR